MTDPKDVCVCGDYRDQHKDGSGVCVFSVGNRGDGHFGAGRCERFRLSKPVEAEQKP